MHSVNPVVHVQVVVKNGKKTLDEIEGVEEKLDELHRQATRRVGESNPTKDGGALLLGDMQRRPADAATFDEKDPRGLFIG